MRTTKTAAPSLFISGGEQLNGSRFVKETQVFSAWLFRGLALPKSSLHSSGLHQSFRKIGPQRSTKTQLPSLAFRINRHLEHRTGGKIVSGTSCQRIKIT